MKLGVAWQGQSMDTSDTRPKTHGDAMGCLDPGS